MALSPGFNQKSSDNNENKNQYLGRKKRPPPSQGFSSTHWLQKHEKIRSMQQYGGPRKYRMEEVKKHNKRDDCWMVLNGNVFDITEYIPYHPGGDEILKAKGRDGTVLFYTFHRWVNVEALIKNCWIGQVLDYQPPNLNNIGKNNKKNATANNSKSNIKAKKEMNPNERNKQLAMSRSRQLMLQKQAREAALKKDAENQQKKDIAEITHKTSSLEIEKEDNLEELE
eukprot:CAMPEP_0197027504 /NCGR_PEP_ID=MMETSP1384-20130603/7403_1 /TAXON_ID=29189 /ORGANISM="Ammonia sp." /LENGTH=225 /DNA_ID=CAMNT_0042456359 /DNA_START=27 /DNA_END=704 /DNA_ORIENTATION=+